MACRVAVRLPQKFELFRVMIDVPDVLMVVRSCFGPTVAVLGDCVEALVIAPPLSY